MVKGWHFALLIIYIAALILLYPVVVQVLMYNLDIMVDRLPHGPFWVMVQVFLSGPLLIVLGLILYFKYGKFIGNKISGAVFCLIGFIWLLEIIKTIISETV